MIDDKLLSSSERYLKKSNRILFLIGLFAVIAFLIGLILLMQEPAQRIETIEPDLTSSVDPFAQIETDESMDLSPVSSEGVSLKISP